MKEVMKIQPSGIFTNYIFKAIPLAFDESLSYYEMLCALLDRLKTDELIINNNADLLAELESYVKNYFDNLDVQEEINNKLDEMALDGTLENLISQYIELQTTYTYNSVAEMKSATNLVSGSFVKTTGYYENNDGGGAYYKVRDILNTDTVDEIYIYALSDENLIAELMIQNNELNIKQIGVKGLVSVDDTEKIIGACQKTFDVYFPKGTYYLGRQLIILNADNKTIRGDGKQKTIFKVSNNQEGNHTSYISTSGLVTSYNLTLKDFSINAGTQTTIRYILSTFQVIGLTLENMELYNGRGYATRLNLDENVYANNLYIHDCFGYDGSVGGGFYGMNMKNVKVSNSTIENCGDHAFYLTGDGNNENSYAENIELNNIYTKNIGSDGYTAGGSFTIYGNIKNVLINNCIVENSLEGVHISNHGDTSITPKNVTITNCVFNNIINSGIYISGLETDFISELTISNNVINTCNTYDGLSIRQCQNSIFNNNIIQNCARLGIEVVNSDYLIINNNILKNNVNQLWAGSRSSTHCKNNTISNNTIYCTNDFKDSNNSGVYITNVCTDTILLCNNAFNQKSYNMFVRGAGNKSILQDGIASTTNYTRKIIYRDSIPSGNIEGDVGDICLNSSPTANGTIGWVCTVAGTPGTWKTFGSISS